MLTQEQRFWGNVHKTDGCWHWIGGVAGKGYGRLYFNGKSQAAHRVSFFIANGRFAQNMVLHKCDIPLCVNPDHLAEGTNADNMVDAVSRGRHFQSSKTHCPQGHPYSGANLYISNNRTHGSKRRNCRKCAKARILKHKLKKANTP